MLRVIFTRKKVAWEKFADGPNFKFRDFQSEFCVGGQKIFFVS